MPERRPRRRRKSQDILREDLSPSIAVDADVPETNDASGSTDAFRHIIVSPPTTEHTVDWDDIISVAPEGRPDFRRILERVSSSSTRTMPTKREAPAITIAGTALTLGADPEFILLDRRGSPMTCQTLETSTDHGHIGDDHSHRVGEFRPNPGSPRQVVENIRNLIAWVRDHKPNTKIMTGGGQQFDLAIGGHIHFNIKNFRFRSHNDGGRDCVNYNDDDPHYYDTPIDRDQSLLNALDSFIGRKLNSMEGSGRAQRVNNSGNRYGLPGDWRPQPHGFEYRTPPSFIGDPVFAESVFAVAHQVAAKWFLNREAFTDVGTRAKKSDYRKLYPTEAEMPSSEDRDYYMGQIQTFVRMAWDSEFRLDNQDVIERWTRGMPNKAEWRDIPLVFNSDEDTGISLRGHITVPMAFRPEINQLRVRGLAEWRNIPQDTIVVSKGVFDAFNLMRHRNQLRNHGLNFIGSESSQWDIMIPHSTRGHGSHASHRMLENFFRALGQDPCIDR